MNFDACLAAVGQGDVDLMVAGLTYGNNRGGINVGTGQGQSATATGAFNADLNDPNNTQFPNGVAGNDSTVAFRLSGTYQIGRAHV